MRYSLSVVVLALASVSTGAQLGTVLHHAKISSTAGGFAGPLRDQDYFGYAVAPVGDLNLDGAVDLAVGAPGDDDGGPYRGAVWILFLDPSGVVRWSAKISSLTGFPGTLVDYGGFGGSLAPLGDLDGDGIHDLAIGAPDRGAVWICLLRRDGSVSLARRIHATDSFFGPLTGLERFGNSLAPIGDIDGNGATDLAIGAPRGGSGPVYGATVWLVRLSRFAAVAGVQQVADGTTGPMAGREFGWTLAAGDIDGDNDIDLVTDSSYLGPSRAFFLSRLVLTAAHNLQYVDDIPKVELETYWGITEDSGWTCLQFSGDLDGDGGLELLVGMGNWRPSVDVQRRRGALLTAFTRPVGPARRTALVASNRGGLATLPAWCYFGTSVAQLGDLDGDGVGDLAVGATHDEDGGQGRGAVWILAMDGSPLRNGSGVNPLTLSELEVPRMAQSWHVDLDCSAHASGLSLLAGYAEGQAGVPSLAGEVLVDPASLQYFRFIQAHAGGVSRFSMAVPVDVALISLPLHLQGMCSGAPGPQLSNALDEILEVP